MMATGNESFYDALIRAQKQMIKDHGARPYDEKARIVAHDLQLQQFFHAYYHKWHLVNLLMIKIQLESREQLCEVLANEIREPYEGGETAEQQVYIQITNGLTALGISETIQLIEELFILCETVSSNDKVLQRLITYKCSKIDNAIASFRRNSDWLRKKFLVPKAVGDISFADDAAKQHYIEGTETALDYFKELVDFREHFKFIYHQYKHGPALALRPVGTAKDEFISERKKYLGGNPVAFDNEDLAIALKRKDRFKGTVMIPNFSPEISIHLTQLMKEKSLLRYANFGEDVSIDRLILLARKATCLIYCLRASRLSFDHDKKSFSCHLPIRNDWDRFLNFSTRLVDF
jgi:hypothetical protein